MKEVPFKLPKGAVLASAIKACAMNPNGVWSYNPQKDVWIDISRAELLPKTSPQNRN